MTNYLNGRAVCFALSLGLNPEAHARKRFRVQSVLCAVYCLHDVRPKMVEALYVPPLCVKNVPALRTVREVAARFHMLNDCDHVAFTYTERAHTHTHTHLKSQCLICLQECANVVKTTTGTGAPTSRSPSTCASRCQKLPCTNFFMLE